MKYAFVKMISPENNEELFITVRDYEEYKKYPIFKDTAVSLVIFSHIYIGGFSLISTIDQIREYNSEAEITFEISLKDICFVRNSIKDVVEIISDGWDIEGV